MCYMCNSKENKCKIDCENNVGGHCMYSKFALPTECDPTECECQRETILLNMIEECSKNGTWENSHLYETTEKILDMIAFTQYEGRQQDIQRICEKLKPNFSLFHVENIFFYNMANWYFYDNFKIIKEYINENIPKSSIGQVVGNIALSLHLGYQIRTNDIETNNLVQSYEIHPNVFWTDGTIRPKWTSDYVTVYLTKKIEK